MEHRNIENIILVFIKSKEVSSNFHTRFFHGNPCNSPIEWRLQLPGCSKLFLFDKINLDKINFDKVNFDTMNFDMKILSR